MPTYKDGKTGLWYCKFVFTDWTGKKTQKKKMGFRLQKEAKAYETEFLSKAHASYDMLFSSLVELYMEDCKSRLKPTTYSNKEFFIGAHVLPCFGNMPISKISATTIRKWQTTLISHPNRYSETYLKAVHNQVSAIFNFACKYYRLPENPARICGAMGRKNADCMLFWTVDEFKQFIEAVSDKIVSTTIFNLLFWSGIRSGEMLALTLNDFDFDVNTVSITKNFARLDNETLILEPKTPKSKRKVALPPFVCDLIKAYVEKLVDYEPTDRLQSIISNMRWTEVVRKAASRLLEFMIFATATQVC